MIITYFRSSSFNTYIDCPHCYFLQYVLGLHSECINNKADKGTIVHKVLEILAKIKKAQQDNAKYIEDDVVGNLENLELFFTTNSNLNLIFDPVYEYYASNSIHDFTDKDKKDCQKWINKVLNSSFDPRQLNIVAPELFFKIELPYDWAHYDFELLDGTKIEGQLKLQGTIDLTTKINDNTYEVIDWKTGKRINWSTGQVKDYDYLQHDPQLSLYHYALTQHFPNIDNFLMTLHHINDGGPITVPYDKNNIEYTLEILKRQFEDIKYTEFPKQNKSWKCKKICHFGKNCIGSKTICQHIHSKILKYGLDYVTQTECINNHDFNTYQDPGAI